MYKISKNGCLKQLYIRGYNLTKKLNKNQTKHSLVFLRAPKHFNIGKHKVLSFKNYYTHSYYTNIKIPVLFFMKNPQQLYNFIIEFHKFHLLYKIASIKVTVKVKIKFL